jgi:plastocyanin
MTTSTHLSGRRAPRSWRMLSLALLLALVAVVASACSSSPSSPSSSSSSSGSTGTHITIQNFAFSPDTLTVKPGATITVTNKDGVDHTVTSLSNVFNTGDIGSGQTLHFTAPTKAGHYPYECMIHQYMTGTLIVS